MEEILFVSDLVGLAEAAKIIGSVVVGVIGTLLWGRGGRKRLVESNERLEADNKNLHSRLAALETKAAAPSISQTFIYSAAPDPRDEAGEIEKAMDQKTVQGLQETMQQLPQEPLSNGHTLARLPEGTNIVSMADGSYRLALPVRLSGVGFTGFASGELKATLIKSPGGDDLEARWQASPGAGRLAAELIAKAPDLEAAREIWEAFYAAPRRTETRWAFYAYSRHLDRYEMSMIVEELMLVPEDIDIDEELEATVARWVEEG